MTQTTGAINTVNGVIHVSKDGAIWTDISGSTNKIAAPSQVADTGEAATLDGPFMIGTSGKLKPLDLDVTILYTENAGEAYAFLQGQATKPNRPIWLRWSPKGTYGSARYTTGNAAGTAAAGVLTAMPFPGADASVAAPTLLSFKVRCTTVIVGVVTPSASLSPSASVSPSASLSPSASTSAGS